MENQNKIYLDLKKPGGLGGVDRVHGRTKDQVLDKQKAEKIYKV